MGVIQSLQSTLHVALLRVIDGVPVVKPPRGVPQGPPSVFRLQR